MKLLFIILAFLALIFDIWFGHGFPRALAIVAFSFLLYRFLTLYTRI